MTVALLSLTIGLGSAAAWQPGHEAGSRADLEVRARHVAKHMLRLQQERFEAQARGDNPETREGIERRLRHSQARHRQITQALEAEQP